MVTLGFDDPLFAQFAFYSVLLILKTLALALLIIRIRIKRKVCFILIDNITNKYFIYMLVFKAFLRDIFFNSHNYTDVHFHCRCLLFQRTVHN